MRVVLLIAVLAAAVGCGASQGATGGTADTQLTITFWAKGRGESAPDRWTLRCQPARGTLPNATAVCGRLLGMTRPFAPVSKNVVCTDQYGGPQQALIAGTYKGQRIWTIVGLRNGCEVSRAKRLEFLVPGLSGNANS